jgi:hypothetical protein
LYRDRLIGGTQLTRRLAVKHNRPCYLVDLAQTTDGRQAGRWLAKNDIRVLNVAGPRESSSPGISRAAYRFLIDLLQKWIPLVK